jgi:hypothetical protein
MTSNRARHELIQLPTIIKVRLLLGTRRQSGTVPGTVPDLAGDGDTPPSPSPICPESGTLPRPRPRFGGDSDGDAPPSPIPIGGSAPWGSVTVPAPGQIGDGRPVPVPGQIGDGDGDGDRGVRTLFGSVTVPFTEWTLTRRLRGARPPEKPCPLLAAGIISPVTELPAN